MHFAIIGKAPPLQGGTATQTLWMAYQLAVAGHDVAIVTTNEQHAENYQCLADEASWQRLRTRYPAFARVSLAQIRAEEPPGVFAIPASDAETTRLASAALEVAACKPIDAVIGVYLEPYGMAAGLVSSALSVPFAFMHAGSDIFRLAQAPTRAAAYRAVLRQADLILSTPSAARMVMSFGISPERLIIGRPSFEPDDLFVPDVDRLAVHDLAAACRDRGWRYHLPEAWPRNRFTVLSYGKVGPQKGTRLLMEAVALASKKIPVSVLVIAPQGASFEFVSNAALELDIAEATAIFPFVAPWDIPGLLAIADAATFLENSFQVPNHRPRIAREIALATMPLIVTREVAEYQRADLVSGKNCLVVDAPYLPEQLAEHIVTLARDPDAARSMGDVGREAFIELPAVNAAHWIGDVITALGIGAEDMALQDLQDALVNIYVNPEYREVDAAKVAQHHDLDADEYSIVHGVLMEPSSLNRFRRSLVAKKWGFLWRQAKANIDADLSDYEDAARARFAAQWRFRDIPLGTEFQEFVDLVADVSADAENPELGKAIALGKLRLGVLFSAGPARDGLLAYSEAIPDQPEQQKLRIAPWAAVCAISSPNEPDSYYVGTPSRTSFAVDLFRISKPIYDFLTAATAFDTFANLRARLATRAEADPADAAAVLRQMISKGVFQFS